MAAYYGTPAPGHARPPTILPMDTPRVFAEPTSVAIVSWRRVSANRQMATTYGRWPRAHVSAIGQPARATATLLNHLQAAQALEVCDPPNCSSDHAPLTG